MNNDWKKQIREDYKNIISNEQIEKTIGYYENILKQQRQKDIEEIEGMFPEKKTSEYWYTRGDDFNRKQVYSEAISDVVTKLMEVEK